MLHIFGFEKFANWLKVLGKWRLRGTIKNFRCVGDLGQVNMPARTAMKRRGGADVGPTRSKRTTYSQRETMLTGSPQNANQYAPLCAQPCCVTMFSCGLSDKLSTKRAATLPLCPDVSSLENFAAHIATLSRGAVLMSGQR
jgi:hypothetical protein